MRNDDLFTVDGDLRSEFLQTRFGRHWGNHTFLYFPVLSADTLDRTQIPPKTSAGVGHATLDVGTTFSSNITTSSPDVLLIHATPPPQQPYQVSEQP
jgi:hypothetical protein